MHIVWTPFSSQPPELQLYPRAGNLPEPEGAGDAVDDPSSDKELSTTDGEDTSDDADSEDLKWCPPNPNAQDDPTEEELVGAAEKLDTMMARVQPPLNIFFTPENLGALPALWLQGKLTISLAPFQEKFAKLFQTIAVELWLRTIQRHSRYLPGGGQKHYDSGSGETCQVHLLPHEEGGDTGHS